jgi:signal transduction histidine kinase
MMSPLPWTPGEIRPSLSAAARVSSARQPSDLALQLTLLNQIAVSINRALNLEDIFHVLETEVRSLFHFDHCSIFFQVENNWQLLTLYGAPVAAHPEDHDAVRQVMENRQAELFSKGNIPGVLKAFTSALMLPLESEREIIGSVHFASRTPNAFSAEDLQMGGLLALQLATAMRNAERFQQLKDLQTGLWHYAGRLEAQNQELDSYNHTVAHDLKAPLTTLRGYISLLDEEIGSTLPDTSRDYLNQIQSSAEGMTRMIEQLLLLAHLRDSDQVLDELDMTMVAVLAAERFSRVVAERHIVLDIAQDLPRACGHAIWLEEVFANLIGNAIKYIGANNPTPRITVRAERVGDLIRYEVADNGIGVAAAAQKRLFEQFSRAHNLPIEGLGLGLSIVQRIVERLNGSVGVDSSPGQGSRFWFCLPVCC